MDSVKRIFGVRVRVELNIKGQKKNGLGVSNILLTLTHNPLPAWKELDEVLDVFYNETPEVEVLSSIDTKQKNGKVEPA